MRILKAIVGCGCVAASACAAWADDPRVQTASVVPAALASEAPPTQQPPTSRLKRYDTLTVVIGGDLGLNPSGQPVSADRVLRHGQTYTFADLTSGLKGHLVGDVVFANLETVVTERNTLTPLEKAFNFRTHPAGIRHLLASGFNVLSTANNHAVDYGEAGIADTIRHLATMQAHGLRGAPGTGFGRAAALAPADVRLSQARVRISAVGIGGGTGGNGDRATMASYHGADFHDAGRRLKEADGDIRMLSVHFGEERNIRPAANDMTRLQDAARTYDIDVIAGHHAHVAAGVQDIDGRLIFYGLGNLLHPGMQDMASQGVCRDFGVLAKVHFGRAEGEPYRVRAVEVWTLNDMHAAVKIRTGDDSRTRLGVLNLLAADLDAPGQQSKGIRFTPQADGRGLSCTAEADANADDLSQRCRANEAPPLPPVSVVQTCGRGDALAAAQRATPLPVSISALHRPTEPPTSRATPWRAREFTAER